MRRHASATPDLAISGVWTRAVPAAGDNGAVYLTIENSGGSADALIGASTDVASAAEMHETQVVDNVMQMRPVPGQRLEVPARGKLDFQPGGLHIMLIGLNKPLQAGDHFPLTLTFEQSGQQQVDVEVRPLDSTDMNMNSSGG